METIPPEASQFNRVSYRYLKKQDFLDHYGDTQIQTGEKKGGHPVYKTHGQAWLYNPNTPKYDGIIFKPNSTPPNGYLNTWKGYATEPKEDKECLALIYGHIENVICNGNPELIEYYLNWHAYIHQNPDKPAGVALVLRGEKGTGKSSIGHFNAKLWGNHAIYITSPHLLTGKFNAHLMNVCFLFADEAFFSGNKESEGNLKALITDPIIPIEGKGKDAIMQPNYLKILMVTNNEHAVIATRDERRYCVIDVSSEKIDDKKTTPEQRQDYFKRLHRDMDNPDIQAAFLYEMLNRDLTNFDINKIPETDGLKAQRLESLDSIGKWLIDSFTSGYFETNKDTETDWKDLMPFKDLKKSYSLWCANKRTSEHRIETDATLAKRLGMIGYENHKNNIAHRIMGNLENAVKLFEDYYKVKIKK